MATKIKNRLIVCLLATFLMGFFVWSLVKPDTLESLSERRTLATFPKLSKETIMSGAFMNNFEKYALDQFPLREQFRTLKAFTNLYVLEQKDNNGVYRKDGYIAKIEYPMNVESLEYATSRFQEVYKRYMADKDMNIYLTIVPDKNYFLAKEYGYPMMDYEQFFEQMSSQMKFAKYIPIAPLLELTDYYETDTHWRQEKIVDVANYLGEQMGVTLDASYTTNQVDDPFYGVYYGQLALSVQPDTLNYLNNETLDACTVYDFETDSFLPIYDFAKTKGKDPYEMFLSGSKSLLTIENPNATTDKELILFRDSFGSSIAPLLVEGYAKITLVDIRYMSPMLLGSFIEFTNQDVLFLYSTSVLNNSNTLK